MNEIRFDIAKTAEIVTIKMHALYSSKEFSLVAIVIPDLRQSIDSERFTTLDRFIHKDERRSIIQDPVLLVKG
jgi:hypothetical protein